MMSRSTSMLQYGNGVQTSSIPLLHPNKPNESIVSNEEIEKYSYELEEQYA